MVFIYLSSCKKHNEQPQNPTQPGGGGGGQDVNKVEISKNSGPYQTVVEITGVEFDTDTTRDRVWFNGKKATITAASRSKLTVLVPLSAGTGKVSVSVDESAIVFGPVFNYKYTMMVTTLAGNFRWDKTAWYNTPMDVAIDSKGNLFVTDFVNNMILKVDTDGRTIPFAGTTTPGFHDGPAKDASFSGPNRITIDGDGNLYVSESGNYAIRKIDPSGMVTTFSSYNRGFTDVPLAQNMAFDADKNMYITGFATGAIWKITPSGTVTLVAGSNQGSQDGPGPKASFAYPHGLVFDKAGNLFVADWYNSTIRKISPDNMVTTFAGSGAIGSKNGVGRNATFAGPDGLAIDSDGNIYVADSGNNLIRKIDKTGLVTTFAGTGAAGNADGAPNKSSFHAPTGLTIDTKGIVYVADYDNKSIRKIGLQ